MRYVFEESAISFKIHCTHLTKSELLFLIFHSQILLYVLALCKCWLPIVKFEEITFLTNSMLNHSMFKSAEAHREPLTCGKSLSGTLLILIQHLNPLINSTLNLPKYISFSKSIFLKCLVLKEVP